MTLLLLSPVLVAIGLAIFFLRVRSRASRKPSAWEFFSTVAFWAVGAVVAAGIVQELVAGFTGQAEPFAIFYFAPPALAVGGVIGALLWRRRLPR